MVFLKRLLLLALLLNHTAFAAERILSYHSEITVLQDGTMEVLDTIKVQSEGREIKRGIYRDFPTDYKDRLGNRYRIRFDVLQVHRDGFQEPYHTERLSNGFRLYIGSRNVILPPGEYEYQIRYGTDRQLGFFKNHDELYWNITGNGWNFQIDEASARVNLPGDVVYSDLSIEGYVGKIGAKDQDYDVQIDTDGSAFIRTTRKLRAREGLTLVLTWPKGYVHEPTTIDKASSLLKDNRGLLMMLAGGLLTLTYLLIAWNKVGRDPPSGVIFPHYTPPEGFSPGSIRFISHMGYDQKSFTAALLNLAVLGHIKIDKVGDTYELRKIHSDEISSKKTMGIGERALYKSLFAGRSTLLLDEVNHKDVRAIMRAHAKALQLNFSKIYFLTNSTVLVPAFLVMVVTVAAVTLFAEFSVAIGIVAGIVVALTLFFGYLLRAPTKKGRKLLDQAEGFKLYLEVAEKDELKLRNPPEKTPELFESYLPYALALGVEQPWAERFAALFARLQQETGEDYQPAWYGGSWNSHNLSGFTTKMSSSLSSAIASASTPPGSSSGSGGGGFSGGGGGGGGGGGW